MERVDDLHHSRGYRELRSKSAMRELVLKKLAEQNGICPWCEKPIEDVREATPDHIENRKMGGAWRDDHPENIRAVHGPCNCERGSKPYLTRKEMLRAEKKARQGAGMKIKAHFVSMEGPLPAGYVVANCGAMVQQPKIADVLEPGTDTQLIVGKYDCSKCVKAESQKERHHFYRVIEDKR